MISQLFWKGSRQFNDLFRSFTLPKPLSSTKGESCLLDLCLVNGYRKVSLFGRSSAVPQVSLREYIDFHLTPDTPRQAQGGPHLGAEEIGPFSTCPLPN